MRRLALAALAAVALSACTSAGTVDQAKVAQYEQTAELIYTGAKVSLTLLCASVPNQPPCNSAAGMAQVQKATAVLDEAFVQARAAIAAAKDADALSVALSSFQSAVAVYARVMATYGVSRGGG